MNNKLTVYPAIFTHTFEKNEEYYEVRFIDFDCFTFGVSLEEAFYMAQDAMGLYLEDLIKFPNLTTDFSNIKLKDNQFISYINIDMDEYRKKYNNKAVKKTLTVPCWLNTLAEKNDINFSQVLQEALKNKLEILDVDKI